MKSRWIVNENEVVKIAQKSMEMMVRMQKMSPRKREMRTIRGMHNATVSKEDKNSDGAATLLP